MVVEELDEYFKKSSSVNRKNFCRLHTHLSHAAELPVSNINQRIVENISLGFTVF